MIAVGIIAPDEQGAAAVGRALRAVLRDGSDPERCLAARALGRVGDRAAVPDLVAALRATDPDLRADAAGSLRDLGDPQAAEQLLENLIGDPDATVKRAALAALATLGDRRLIPWLVRLIRARDPEITWDDAAFYANGWDDWLDVQVAAVQAAAQMQVAETIPDILAVLGDDEGQDLGEIAVRALARMRATGVAALAGLLHDPVPRTRRRAAAALAGITGQDIAAPLAAALDDPAPEVRLAALRARAEVAPADPLLAQMAFDSDPEVRAAALRLLPAPAPELLPAMLDDASGPVRAAVLAHLTNPAVPADPALDARLADLAGDGDGAIAAAAMAALCARAPDLARHHLAALATDPGCREVTRLTALRALDGVSDVSLVDSLASAARTETGPIRAAALVALVGIARRAPDWPNPAVAALLAALGNAPWPEPEDSPEDSPEYSVEPSPPAVAVVAEQVPAEPPFPASTLDSILARNAAMAVRPRRRVPVAAACDNLRALTARLLGDLPRAEVAMALATELASADADLAAAAADGLARIAEVGTGLPGAAVRALLMAAEGSPPALQRLIIRALGPTAGLPEVGALLRRGLADADPGLRAAAAAALAAGGCGAAAAPALDDADDVVRLAAAHAVAGAGDPAFVPHLVRAALSRTADLARPVARLLRALDASAASAALIAVLGDPGQRRDRGPAIEMLEEINGEHWAAAEPARPADHQTSEV